MLRKIGLAHGMRTCRATFTAVCACYGVLLATHESNKNKEQGRGVWVWVWGTCGPRKAIESGR